MFRKILLYFFFTCLICYQKIYSQTYTIDSLRQQVSEARNNKEKLGAIFSLCAKRHSLSTDTLFRYATMARKLSKESNNEHNVILSDYYYINYLIKRGKADSALVISDNYIFKLANNLQEKQLYLNFLGTRAGLLIKLNRYKESFATYYRLLNEAEKFKDTINILLGQIGLGWVNMEMDNNKEALLFLNVTLRNPAMNNVEKYGEYYSFIYSNISAAYNSIGKNDSAEYFINKAIPLAKKFENLTSLANALAIKADIMSATKRNKEAENALLEVVSIRRQIGDPFFIVSDMSQLAVYYYHNNQPKKGISIAKEGIDVARQNNLTSKLLLLYQTLAQNYDAAGDYKMYSKTLQTIINLKDSLYDKNSAEALAEIQGKYEVQKKENTIAQQNLKIIKSKNLLYGTFAILIFSIIISFIFFNEYRKREKLKAQLLLKEEKRQSEIAVNNAAENERKRIAADLHDNMGAYATAIIANVDDMIANKNIPSEPAFINLKNNAGELMSNLRDTIWASNKEKISLINISDRFKNYMQKINRTYPNTYIEIDEAITNNIHFSPVVALNIFRILQEACTNALKHSAPGKISIHFKSDINNLCITVTDNGNGITDVNYLQNGNGIKNMQLRAAEAGLQFSIVQETGVTIILSLLHT